MIDYTLCNLVFDDEGFFEDFPQIALRANDGCVRHTDDGTIALTGDVDFTTYLNALSIGKWRRYADVESVHIHLVCKGAPFEVYATSLTPASTEVDRSSTPIATVDESASWQQTDVVVPCPQDAHVVSFALVSRGEVQLREGSWRTRVNEAAIRDVRLAIATTTFKKEAYVMRNIESIRSTLFAGGRTSHDYHLFVIDNGRTIDTKALSDNNITVIPNPNVGGSGGFARGMMAALDADATHVLLMDDDVRVFPESFRRTHALLSLVTKGYENALIEGGMLNMEDPNLLFEDVATVKRDGMYGAIKPELLIDTVEGIAASEATDVEQPRAYGAWWYCCIPISLVREHGLPLPLFVRCDDVEYGMRVAPTIMTMNGICVWHERFEGRFKAAVDSYQLTRNFLIMAACDELDPAITRAFMLRFSRTFHIYLRSMNYDTCELMLDGLADYLKGPSFIMSADGEKILMHNSKLNEVLVDVSELDQEIVGKAKPDPRFLGQKRDRGMFLKVLEAIPHDRHVLPDFLLRSKPAAMYYSRGAYPARRTMGRKVLVAYDQSGTKARIRTMDRDRWRHLRTRFAVLTKAYRKQGKEVAQEYRSVMPTITSRAFWEEYLEARA
ncbi:MAG: glycosyltransferase [Atopobiaceae bacterium]|nr:glycosyltransferase [Atopobiaceae bacterium]